MVDQRTEKKIGLNFARQLIEVGMDVALTVPISRRRVAQTMFGGWEYITNLKNHYNERIWMTWRPDFIQVDPISMTE